MTIPGMERRTAEVILAEVGAEMDRFPSAGKRLGGRSQRGSPWLRSALTEAAWGRRA